MSTASLQHSSKDIEAATLQATARSLLAEGKVDEALTVADNALALFRATGNRMAQSQVMHTKIEAYLKDNKKPEARGVAHEAVAIFREVNDAAGEASAQLLVAKACISTRRYQEALSAGHEALSLARRAASRALQLDSLRVLYTAAMEYDLSQAISIATDCLKLLRNDSAEQKAEAEALIDLAKAHLGRLCRKLGSCSIASSDDTIAALRAAKDAHAIFGRLRDNDAQAKALELVAKVLLYNGVHPEVVEASANPEEIFADVMSGRYSSSKNALPPKPQTKQLKVEEVIPDSKQLDRGKFGWNNPTAGFCYTLVWQPAKDRNVGNNKPRGQYDILTLGTGAKQHAAATTLALRSNDASERNEAMVVFMTTPDCNTNYATSMMNAQHTLAGMVSAQLRKMVFVQFGESFFDWTDSAARQVEMHSVTLALLRSARIEAPFLTIGFVGGDTASWMMNPAPMISSIFDTIESDECELIYKNGEPFGPSMVHKPLDETVQSVKPGKMPKFSRP